MNTCNNYYQKIIVGFWVRRNIILSYMILISQVMKPHMAQNLRL